MAATSCSVVTSSMENSAPLLSEPQHVDAVGDGLDVGHVVADEHHAEAAAAQALDEVEHLGGLRDAERGGRLVEHDHLGVAHEAAGDGDGLPLPAGERGDRDADRRDLGGELTQQLPRALLHLDLVERAGRGVLLAEVQVGDDVEVVAQREVLEDRGDAELLRLLGAVDGDAFAVEDHLTLVGRVDAGHDLDERRLAGAVVADQGDDLTGVHVDRDILERLHGAETLADARHREHGCCCCGSHGLTLEPFRAQMWQERDGGDPVPLPIWTQLRPASAQASA